MMGFQAVSNTGVDMAHKAVASIAALGGAAVLPILCWQKPKASLFGLAVGAGLGCTAAAWAEQSGGAAMGTVFFSAAGCASLAGAIHHRDRVDRLLLCWLGIGFLFLLSLRFTASRYWIPFFAPAVLLALRGAHPLLTRAACLITIGLSAGLALDDMDLAQAQRTAAAKARSVGVGHVAGHWGFQHHLESTGWTPVEDDQMIEPNAWVASSRIAWPQQPANTCWLTDKTFPISDPRPGLRVLTYDGGANLHGHMLSGETPTRIFSPWGLGADPLDHLILQRTCP